MGPYPVTVKNSPFRWCNNWWLGLDKWLTWCSFPLPPSRLGPARRFVHSSAYPRGRRGFGHLARGLTSSGSQIQSDGSALSTVESIRKRKKRISIFSTTHSKNRSKSWFTDFVKLYLSRILVFYPGADVRVQCEIWSKVFKILCGAQPQEDDYEKEILVNLANSVSFKSCFIAVLANPWQFLRKTCQKKTLLMSKWKQILQSYRFRL